MSSKAEDMAEKFERGEVDLDHDVPASGGSGKNRTKTEQVRDVYLFFESICLIEFIFFIVSYFCRLNTSIRTPRATLDVSLKICNTVRNVAKMRN
jgi:hypothetical protein